MAQAAQVTHHTILVDSQDHEKGPKQHPRAASAPINNAVARSDPRKDPQPNMRKQKEWKGWKLHWATMSIMAVMQGGLLAAIAYLAIRSSSRNGISNVPQAETPISAHFAISKIWKYGLLWTTLPSLVMTGYKVAWDTVVSATAGRQPFVELMRGASAKKTIMLDYRSYIALAAWTKAFGNRHFILGSAMLLEQIFSIAVIPLTAHLFVAAPSESTSVVTLSYPTTYNEFGLENTTSLQPAIDLATANRVYNGIPPPWMTLQYAFESFDVPTAAQPTGNLTANTTAYSAILDCKSYSPEDSGATYQTAASGASVNYQMNDRGCEISGYVEIFSATPTYAMSWTSVCNNSEIGRVGIFAGIYSNDSSIKIDPTSYSLVSCIVNYWNTSGLLTVAVQPSDAPKLIAFNATANVSMYPFLHGILEETFKDYKFFDPSNNIQADAFGFSVLSYAKTQNETSPITPDLIASSMADVFQTLYAGMVVQVALPQAGSPLITSGELSTPITRLYVVTPIAWTIVAILSFILVCNIFLLFYARWHTSIVLEKPTGVLGIATILYPDDDVIKFVTDFRKEHEGEDKIQEVVSQNYKVKESNCRMDEVNRHIRITDLVEVKKKEKKKARS